MENILILGVGKMGFWIAGELVKNYRVALLDKRAVEIPDDQQYQIITSPSHIPLFRPQMVINAVNLQAVTSAFQEVIPFLDPDTLLVDVASLKNKIKEFYHEAGFDFVSVHPMFGPTFGNLKNLHGQHAVIISESAERGSHFFSCFFNNLDIHLHRLSFRDHDSMMASSLGLPLISSLIFSAGMDSRDIPGTSFQKQLQLAEGIFSEEPGLLSEILLNLNNRGQITFLKEYLTNLEQLIEKGNKEGLLQMFQSVRKKIMKNRVRFKKQASV